MAEFKNSAAEKAHQHFRTNHDPRLHDRGYARRHAQSTILSSPTSDLGTSRNTKQAESLRPEHALSSEQETFVIASGEIMKYPGRILETEELDTIFDEVSTLISGNDLQKIHFKLETSERKIVEVVMNSLVERGEMGCFRTTIQRFRRCIEESKEALRIVLEPHA